MRIRQPHAPKSTPPALVPRPVPVRAVRTRVKAGHRPVRRCRVGHLVLAVVLTLVVVGALGWLGQMAGDGLPAETTVVRVGAGETVWDVAHRVAPGSDPQAMVQRIRRLNGMTSSAVVPGQQLRVPDGR